MKTGFLPKTTFLLCSTAFLLAACGPDEPEKTDPCAQAKPFTAGFSIKEPIGDSLVRTNIVTQYSGVVFEAAGDYDSYEWKIGYSDETYTTKKVRLLFTEAFGLLPVRLIARGKPNPCIAGDDGVDTLTQNLDVVFWRQSPLIGRYEGYFDSDKNKTDKQTVTVTFRQNSYDEFGAFFLTNINKGCNVPEIKDGVFSISDVRGAAGLFSAWDGGISGRYYNGCLAPYIWLRLRGEASDTLVADFKYGEVGANEIPGPKRYADKFVGRRTP